MEQNPQPNIEIAHAEGQKTFQIVDELFASAAKNSIEQHETTSGDGVTFKSTFEKARVVTGDGDLFYIIRQTRYTQGELSDVDLEIVAETYEGLSQFLNKNIDKSYMTIRNEGDSGHHYKVSELTSDGTQLSTSPLTDAVHDNFKAVQWHNDQLRGARVLSADELDAYDMKHPEASYQEVKEIIEAPSYGLLQRLGDKAMRAVRPRKPKA